jgi:hypothetical protein
LNSRPQSGGDELLASNVDGTRKIAVLQSAIHQRIASHMFVGLVGQVNRSDRRCQPQQAVRRESSQRPML